MFRKVVRRFNLGALLVAALGVVAHSGAGGSFAGLPSLPDPVSYSSTDAAGNPCPGFGFSERHYCLVVTTQSGLARSGGVEVDLTVQNYDTGTLNKPAADLTWDPSSANLTFVSSSPSSCSYPSSDGGVACSFPDIPGLGSASGTGNPPPHNDATVKLFFTVNEPADLHSVTFTGTGTAKERSNDNGGAANVEQQKVTGAVMSFGTDPNASATMALPAKSSLLNAGLDASSVGFAVPKGTSPFIAKFAADPSTTACFGGITCSGLLLTTDLSAAPNGTFSVGNQILWTAVINSTSTNVDAIHYYDPVTVTASPTTKTFTSTTSFASCDGVNFATAPTGLQANQDYFVVKATATSFQVSTSANGKPLSFTDSGQFKASCIRVIGDNPGEKLKGCTIDKAPAAPAAPPGICAAKVDNSTVKVYLWDSANGGVHI
jgi:hypothetical protein